MATGIIALIVGLVGAIFAAYERGRRVEADIWIKHWPAYPYDEHHKEIGGN